MSREGRPNPIPPNRQDEGGWVFTDEMLQAKPWAEVFATRPEEPLEARHKFYNLICMVNVSMPSRDIYEIKRHYQSATVRDKTIVTEIVTSLGQ